NSSGRSSYVTDETALQQRLRALLRERSVTRGDFVLASGKRSTYYIDARRTTMAGEGIAIIGALGLARIRARGWQPRAVGGLTLGADPVAYAIAAAAHAQGVGIDAFTVRRQAARLDRRGHGPGAAPQGPGDVPAQPPAAVGHRGRPAPDRARGKVLRGDRGVALLHSHPVLRGAHRQRPVGHRQRARLVSLV